MLTGQLFGAFMFVESLLSLHKVLLVISTFRYTKQVKFSITVISITLSDYEESVVDLNADKE